MATRRNWLEPAVRAYLVCAVGSFVVGSLAGLTWLKLIGGSLVGFALIAAGAAGLYLFIVRRAGSITLRNSAQTGHRSNADAVRRGDRAAPGTSSVE